MAIKNSMSIFPPSHIRNQICSCTIVPPVFRRLAKQFIFYVRCIDINLLYTGGHPCYLQFMLLQNMQMHFLCMLEDFQENVSYIKLNSVFSKEH